MRDDLAQNGLGLAELAAIQGSLGPCEIERDLLRAIRRLRSRRRRAERPGGSVAWRAMTSATTRRRASGVIGLVEEIDRAQLHGGDRLGDAAVRGQDHDRNGVARVCEAARAAPCRPSWASGGRARPGRQLCRPDAQVRKRLFTVLGLDDFVADRFEAPFAASAARWARHPRSGRASFGPWSFSLQERLPRSPRLSAGKVNVNVGSFTRLAGDLDLAAVGRDDLANDRQAQACAAGMPVELGTR